MIRDEFDHASVLKYATENQNALVAFSRFLETKIAAAAGDTDEILRSIGQRLVSSMRDAGNHAEVAMERLEAFLKLKV